MTIPFVIGVNPLQTTLLELGIVSGRVALLLRSAEIQPVFPRFVIELTLYPPPPSRELSEGWKTQRLNIIRTSAQHKSLSGDTDLLEGKDLPVS